ncbi:MAG: hypothetical protein K2K57_06035, partial [Oscillospiraceae bacterium]|nr:hypothetical protein [Oscillospiraceae bacterium]
MKKNAFAITAATAFAAVLLSSCNSMTDNNITDEQGREIIVLARNEADEFSSKSINLLIKEYNNSDRKFYIEEKKYLSSDNLLVDIIGGENIDVLFVNGWIDTTPLYAKGVICDLYEFIDNDGGVSRDTYVDSVLKALEKDGKLYEIPYDFYVESAIVKTDLWGDDNDTSFEHITEKSKSLGCNIPYDLSFDSYAFISYIISEYVDLTNSSCSFDDGKFEEYIKFMKQYYNSI